MMTQPRNQPELFIPPDAKGITDFFTVINSRYQNVLESDFSQGIDSYKAKMNQIERDVASIRACGAQTYCSAMDKSKVEALIKDLNHKSEALKAIKDNLQHSRQTVESKQSDQSLSVTVDGLIPPAGFSPLSPSIFSSSPKLMFPPKKTKHVQAGQPVEIAVEDLLNNIRSILNKFDWKHKRQWVLSSDEPPGILEMRGIVNNAQYLSYQSVQQLNDIVSVCEEKAKEHKRYKSPQGYLYLTLSKLRIPDTQILDLDKLDQIKKELSDRFSINDAESTVSYKKK